MPTWLGYRVDTGSPRAHVRRTRPGRRVAPASVSGVGGLLVLLDQAVDLRTVRLIERQGRLDRCCVKAWECLNEPVDIVVVPPLDHDRMDWNTSASHHRIPAADSWISDDP